MGEGQPGSGTHRPWLDVYHLKASHRWERTGGSWQQQQQTQEQQSHHLQMLQGKKKKKKKKKTPELKISTISMQTLMCVKSQCFGLEMGLWQEADTLKMGPGWHFSGFIIKSVEKYKMWANEASRHFNRVKENKNKKKTCRLQSEIGADERVKLITVSPDAQQKKESKNTKTRTRNSVILSSQQIVSSTLTEPRGKGENNFPEMCCLFFLFF